MAQPSAGLGWAGMERSCPPSRGNMDKPSKMAIVVSLTSSLSGLCQSLISNTQTLIWKLSSLLDVNKALPGRRVVSPPHTPFAFSPATRWSRDHHLPWACGEVPAGALHPSATGTGLSLPCSPPAQGENVLLPPGCPQAA